jgi:thiamine pyrophosphate-dependent acetolactate synthase large subunit-like protein
MPANCPRFKAVMSSLARQRYRHIFVKPVKVVVIKNNTLGMINWEQMVLLGNPEYGCDLHPHRLCDVRSCNGGVGLTVDDPVIGELLKSRGDRRLIESATVLLPPV